MPRDDDDDNSGYRSPRPRRSPPRLPKRGLNQVQLFIIAFGLIIFVAVPVALAILFFLRVKNVKPDDPPAVVGGVVAEQLRPPAGDQIELPAWEPVPLPRTLPRPAEIPDDPFKERKEAFRQEWPRFANRGQAWNIEPDRLDLAKPFENFGPAIEFNAARIKEGRLHTFVFPTSPSPYLAVPADFGKKPSASIHDLRSGEVIGTIDTKLELIQRTDLRLSADGKWLAGAMVDHFMLYPTAGGEPKRVPAKFRNWYDFGHDSNHLLSLVSEGGRQSLVQIDLQTGESRSLRVDLPAELTQKAMAFSPNRKILSCVSGDKIVLLEASTGKQIAARSTPALTFNKAPTCTAMAFSADGSRWVGAFGGIKHGLYVIDVASGASIAEFPVPAEVSALVPGHTLQMTPDGRGVLLNGQYLLDATSGSLVRNLGFERKFAKSKQSTEAVMLADWTLVERVEDGSIRDLSTAKFDRERFDQEVAAANGGADSVVRKPVDRKAVNVVTIREVPDWNVSAGGANPNFNPPQFPESGPIHALAVDPTSRLAFALRAAGKTDNPASRELQVDVASLDGATPPKSIVIGMRRPTGIDDYHPVFDASAKFAAFVDPANPQLTIITPLEGGRSFAIQPGGDWSVEWLAFAGPDTLLTVAGDGRLTTWKLPEARAIWTLKTAAKSAAIDPARKTVAVYSGTRFEFLNPANGETLGAIGVSEAATEVFRKGTAAASFSGDGKTFVAVFPAFASRAIGRWDLATGKSLGEPIALPQRANGTVQSLGNEHALIGSAELLNFTLKRSLCQFHFLPKDQPTIAVRSPDSNLWYVAPQSSRVEVVAVPPPRVRHMHLALQDGSLRAVLPRGEQVAIDVQLVGCSLPQQNLVKESLVNRLSELLKARGHTIDPAAQYRVTLVATETQTGEQVELKKIREFFDSPGGTVRLRGLAVQLEVSGPRVTHKADTKIRNKIQIGRKFPPGDDVDLRLRQELWGEAGDWAAGAVDVSNIYITGKGATLALPILLDQFDQ